MVNSITISWARKVLKTRKQNSHKGENGRVLVVGGARRYFGAPALVGLAALRSGADLAYLLVPDYISRALAALSPDLIIWDFEGEVLNDSSIPAFREISDKCDALVIGNGLTKQESALSTAKAILSNWHGPCVIDGDVIGFAAHENGVLTPHAGEFKRLGFGAPEGGLEARARQVRQAARELGMVILLKGVVDVVSDGERIAFNKTGNAAMTVGGTGDILAGVLGALLAQGHDPFEAACLAAFINGSAGDLAFAELGYSILASDLLDYLPSVFKRLRH
ncbi:MAG: NAD(P)H-hydrate dehydratase [Candidatus Micrarchaeia archaeon]